VFEANTIEFDRILAMTNSVEFQHETDLMDFRRGWLGWISVGVDLVKFGQILVMVDSA